MAAPIRKRLAVIPVVEIAILHHGLGGGNSPMEVSVIEDIRRVLAIDDVKSSAEDVTSIISVRLKREAANDLGVFK